MNISLIDLYQQEKGHTIEFVKKYSKWWRHSLAPFMILLHEWTFENAWLVIISSRQLKLG